MQELFIAIENRLKELDSNSQRLDNIESMTIIVEGLDLDTSELSHFLNDMYSKYNKEEEF